jgi:cellulose synthase/poly-beta-1,6-N-acetylglucosamine synthase-like glycosyltransferase
MIINFYEIIISLLLILMYSYTLYNIPIIIIGLKNRIKRKKSLDPENFNLPKISIIVPTKDEEKVISRAIEALLNLNYPKDKKEIIIVEDGSKDKTKEICEEYEKRYPDQIKLINRNNSNGKPAALNEGLKYAKGDIIAFFDADNVPESDILLKIAKIFSNNSIIAIQGRTCSINSDQNMLTKIISLEENVWFESFLEGRKSLNLFIPFTGSCQFIKRDIINEIGGFNENSIVEDVELSLRLLKKGYKVHYIPEVISWQESPSNFSSLKKQRLRWYRGYMDLFLKNLSFFKSLKKYKIDAEVVLLGPYMLSLSFISYMIGAIIILFKIPLNANILFLLNMVLFLFLLILFLLGISLIVIIKPRKIKNIKWLPFIYIYWFLQSILATTSLIKLILRRKERWNKTDKTGVITNEAIYENIKKINNNCNSY